MNREEDGRITELEMQLAHLQRQYDVLNEVVTEQAMEIGRLDKRIAKWEAALDLLKNKAEPMGDPLDEKPPHY